MQLSINCNWITNATIKNDIKWIWLWMDGSLLLTKWWKLLSVVYKSVCVIFCHMQNTMRGKFACAFETTDSLQSQLTRTRSVSLHHSLSPRPRLRSALISYQKQSIHCRAVAEWKTTNVGTQNMYTKTLYIKMFFLSDWLCVVLWVLILRWWFDFKCFKVFLGDNFSIIWYQLELY